MDEIDARICGLLMANSRVPLRELAERLGLSLQAVHRRIQVMQGQGVIKGYPASLSLSYLNAVVVYIFGSAAAPDLGGAIAELRRCDRTYIVLVSGFNHLSIGAILKDMSELEDYVELVRRTTSMAEPKVGLMSVTQLNRAELPGAERGEELTALDYRIVRALKEDARRPVEEVAAELGVSAATARRRLDRMVAKGLVSLGVDWRPSASGDVVSQLHITLRPGVDKLRAGNAIMARHSAHLLAFVTFGNLPDFIMAVAWTKSMKELSALVEGVAGEEGVASVVPNVIISEDRYDTWIDKLVEQRAGQRARG